MYFYIAAVQCLLVLLIGNNSSGVLAREVIGLGNHMS